MTPTIRRYARTTSEAFRDATYATAIEVFPRRSAWFDRACWALAGVLWVAVMTSPWWWPLT